MLLHLGAGLMEIVERRARQLELAARLERDRRLAARKPDEIVAVIDRLPAEPPQPFEQAADAALAAVIGDRPQILAPEDEFLVLGADAPALARLGARGEIFDKLPPVGDRLTAGKRRSGHETGRPLIPRETHRRSVAAAGAPRSSRPPAPGTRPGPRVPPFRCAARAGRGRPGKQRGVCRRASSSVSANPPSGPDEDGDGPGASAATTSAMGGAVPVSSQKTRRLAPGQLCEEARERLRRADSGKASRSLCSAASRAMASSRSGLMRSATVRSVTTGRSVAAPSSVAFSTSHSSRARLIRAKTATHRPRSRCARNRSRATAAPVPRSIDSMRASHSPSRPLKRAT